MKWYEREKERERQTDRQRSDVSDPGNAKDSKESHASDSHAGPIRVKGTVP